MKIAAVVITGGRVDIVDKHPLGRRIDGVVVRKYKSGHTVDGRAVATARPIQSVIDIDEAIAGECRIDGNAEETPLAVRTDPATDI
jgi:hypothetical protein